MEDSVNKAMLGDKESARVCTANEVLIPCPHCGSDGKMLPIKIAVEIPRTEKGVRILEEAEIRYRCGVECESCFHRLSGMGESIEAATAWALYLWNERTDVMPIVRKLVCGALK